LPLPAIEKCELLAGSKGFQLQLN